MDRRMFINAVHREEVRIAISEGADLVELEIESDLEPKLKGNIYKAKISRIEPSLQAAFIDIGTERNGFLQINDIHSGYFQTGSNGDRGHGRPSIQDVLHAGQEIVVQVVKEEREQKGATLTTYLSLPGRYTVIMPGSDRAGISRRISDSEQRGRLKRLAQELEIPAGIGMIIRTAGLDRSQADLARDLSMQLKLWEQIVTRAQTATCPAILYKESDLATRVIRDYFTPDIREILIDDLETFNHVKDFVGQVMPRYRSRIKLYDREEPLLAYYSLDTQVDNTLKRTVKLHSGGELVIDTLEALVAIDVNSGKATAGENIEETAYRTNLEAAEEIARQLRLRDLGGLIVIDFIDMLDRKHKAAVERKLNDAVAQDKARVEIGRLSKFGLLEMSRQRLRASLTSQSHLKCQQCQGSGRIRSSDLVALDVLRKIQSAIIIGHVSLVKARLSPSAAMFLLNRKKGELSKLEQERKVTIYILGDGRLRPDEYEFELETSKGKITTERGEIPFKAPTPSKNFQSSAVAEEPEETEEEFDEEDEDAHPGHVLNRDGARKITRKPAAAPDEDEIEEETDIDETEAEPAAANLDASPKSSEDTEL